MRQALLVCVLAALACLARSGRADEPLRWKFTPGEELRYELRQETQSRTLIGERDLKSSIQQIMRQSWRVKSVAEDGAAEVGLTFDRMQMLYDTPNGVLQIDTAGDSVAEGDLAKVEQALRAIAGTEMRMRVSPRGEISDIEIPEAVEKTLQQSNGKDSLEASISPESLKAMILASTVVMPLDAIHPDSTWTNEREQLGIKLLLTYKYTGREEIEGRKVDTIDVSGEISLGDQPPVAELELKIDQQNVKGVIHFDAAAGRLNDMEVTQKTAIDISSGGTTGRQEVQVVMSHRLLDKDDAKGAEAQKTPPSDPKTGG